MTQQGRRTGRLLLLWAALAALALLLVCGGGTVLTLSRGASDTRALWALALDYPTRLYQGEEATIRLTFRPPPAPGAAPTVTLTTPGRTTSRPTAVQVRNLFDTHIVVGHATLEGDEDLQIRTPEQEAEIEPGQEQRWEWVVTPREAGTTHIRATLRLVFTPKESLPDTREVTQRFATDQQAISVFTILGLSGRQARLLLTASTFISGASGALTAGIALWEKIRGLVQKPAEPSSRPADVRRKTGKSRTRHKR
jgi:hypothetical protein